MKKREHGRRLTEDGERKDGNNDQCLIIND